jgi:hypothetical protein
MRKILPRVLVAIAAGGLLPVLLSMTVSPAFGAKGDCGQPSSNGAKPAASDALTCLKEAVGQDTACDDKPCICDISGDGTTAVSDCLRLLKIAVGQPLSLDCDCGPDGFPCTSGMLESRLGSDLDTGWTGIAHDQDLILGARVSARILRRCSDDQSVCLRAEDCDNGDCVATCDCIDDPSCEITGPTHSKNCLTTLADCDTNRCLLGGSTQGTACTTNSDCTGGAVCSGSTGCPNGISCLAMFGPPLPLSSGGTPVCVLSLFDSPVTGTANSATGEGQASLSVKSRVFFGIQAHQPCPRCGAPDQQPAIGDSFTCEDGQFPGTACTVDGVSPIFGGTSFDCPPMLNTNVSGTGLAIRFREVTTGTTTKTAQLPCANLNFRSNPLNAPTDPGKCLDNNSACTSNADCKRCTEDPTTTCTNDTQCTGKGNCAEAPDQPITCGYWCQCGFCNGNASQPCFETSDCASGETCQVGPGSNAQNVPQQKPNDCADDGNICGELETERCATTEVGECSDQPYRNCQSGSTTCEDNNAGFCVVTARPCFESRITRTGRKSPLGQYCAFASNPDGSGKLCTTNGDCPDSSDVDDFCANQSSRPETVALFCVPATTSSSINNVGGLTGPGAIRFSGFIQTCSCGDSIVGCDEECEDGNTIRGDGCDDYCQDE